nr:hypothetical protein CFP56_09732 [Quercus suber]
MDLGRDTKSKEDHLTLPFKNILSTLTEANGMGFNVGWLVSRVITLRDLQKIGPFVHASLSLLQLLRVKRDSCINKAEETKKTMEARIASIAKFQESITKLQGDLSSAQEDYSAFRTQLEGVKAEQGSFDKEIEKLESKLGTVSHPDFSFENINALKDII